MRKVNIILSTLCIALAAFALAFGNGACIDEDFSQDTGLWTEYDPNGKIELDYTTDHRLEFNNWIRPEPGYVSRPYSAQDFVLDFDIRITASGGNAKVIGPGFSDNLATIDQVQNGIHVVYYAGFPTVSPRLSINTRVAGTTEWSCGGNPPQPNRINIGKNVTYYVRLEKSGTSLTLSVFSDQGRTTHIAGSPKTVTTTLSETTFNYFYAVNGYTTSPVGNWEWTTGWIDNLKACGGTVPPTTRTLTVTKVGTGNGTVTSTPPGIDCGTTCTASYDQGTTVALTATPDANSVFAGWSGDCSGLDTTTTVIMDADKTCTATFNKLAPEVSLLPVPYFYQGTTEWCVLNSIAMVLQYYGKSVHAWDLAERWNQGHEDTTDVCVPYDFKLDGPVDQVVESYGLSTEWRECGCFNEPVGGTKLHLDFEEDFTDFLSEPTRTPVIIWGGWERPSHGKGFHFVVVVGYETSGEKQYLYVHDPAALDWFDSDQHGKDGMFVKVPWEDFKSAYEGKPGGMLVIRGTPSPPTGTIWLQDDGLAHHVQRDHVFMLESGLYLDKGLVYKTQTEIHIPGFSPLTENPEWLRWLIQPTKDSNNNTWTEALSPPALELWVWLANCTDYDRTYYIEVHDSTTQQIWSVDCLSGSPDCKAREKTYCYCPGKVLLEKLGTGEHNLHLYLKSEHEGQFLLEDTIGPIQFWIVTPQFPPAGDVSGDGIINVLDARLCLQIATGLIQGTPEQRAAADVDGDGDVDLTDAQILAEYIIGIRATLP